ncbi:hypothetical protein PR048_028942 [Dryococelus australis]|uniref:Uncharacterized protein n=1 Tax=Dryococelus australis TaxID=614101 RepID=A0ABQ9GC10_9NEOP|nr:hypothetical protein PR048_028942 [Dryococelus australis]
MLSQRWNARAGKRTEMLQQNPPTADSARESNPVHPAGRRTRNRENLGSSPGPANLMSVFHTNVIGYTLATRRGPFLPLLVSHQDEPGSIPGWVAPMLSHLGIVPDTMLLVCGFSRRSPVSPSIASRRCSILIGSQDHDVKSTCPRDLFSLVPGTAIRATITRATSAPSLLRARRMNLREVLPSLRFPVQMRSSTPRVLSRRPFFVSTTVLLDVHPPYSVRLGLLQCRKTRMRARGEVALDETLALLSACQQLQVPRLPYINTRDSSSTFRNFESYLCNTAGFALAYGTKFTGIESRVGHEWISAQGVMSQASSCLISNEKIQLLPHSNKVTHIKYKVNDVKFSPVQSLLTDSEQVFVASMKTDFNISLSELNSEYVELNHIMSDIHDLKHRKVMSQHIERHSHYLVGFVMMGCLVLVICFLKRRLCETLIRCPTSEGS